VMHINFAPLGKEADNLRLERYIYQSYSKI